MAESLNLTVKVVKKHLNLLCLVGLFVKKKQGYGSYWYNYIIQDCLNQQDIELQNKGKIMTAIEKTVQHKALIKTINSNKKDLSAKIKEQQLRIEKLEEENQELYEKMFDLEMEKQELLFVIMENGLDRLPHYKVVF
jgi:cell shape-determining protein MreC